MNIPSAIANKTSVYEKTITPAKDYKYDLLKEATGNVKLDGGNFRKGAHKGLPLYSLTLVERMTCYEGCAAFKICYGNKMQFANRIKPDAFLMPRLHGEIKALSAKHPDGFSVRLHVLGDFYSAEYVEFWGDMLARYPQLHAYGYTHQVGEIKASIDSLWLHYGARFNILQSDGDCDDIRPIALLETTLGADKLPVCPQQVHTDACKPNCNRGPKRHVGKVAGCTACGLCTNASIKGVRFLVH